MSAGFDFLTMSDPIYCHTSVACSSILESIDGGPIDLNCASFSAGRDEEEKEGGGKKRGEYV